jgi:hypothetical protein
VLRLVMMWPTIQFMQLPRKGSWIRLSAWVMPFVCICTMATLRP